MYFSQKLRKFSKLWNFQGNCVTILPVSKGNLTAKTIRKEKKDVKSRVFES